AGVESFTPHAFKRRTRTLLIAGVAGAAIALLILVTAPGGQGRAELFRGVNSPVELMANAVIHAAALAVSSIIGFAPLGALSALLLGGLIALREDVAVIGRDLRWM